MVRGAGCRHLLAGGLWLASLAIATLGCAAAATAVPSGPTPDIDATVDARVRTVVADLASASIEPTLPSAPGPVLQATDTPPPTVPAAMPLPGPTPDSTSTTPMPTPNIDATVEARLQEAVAAMPTTAVPTVDIDSTVEARVRATIAAMPQSTPNPTPAAPSATPAPAATETPIPVPIQEAVPPTPMPPTVYGVLEVSFEPRGAFGTTAPDPPIDAALRIESVDGEERIHWINDPDPGTGSSYKKATTLDFALALEPGDYQIVGLVGQHSQLGDEAVSFPPFRVGLSGLYKFATLGIMVPETGCIHIGRISATYFRVSPGSRAEQDRVLDQINREIRGTVHYVYLSAGSLVAKTAQNAVLDRDEWIDEAKTRDCELAQPKWVVE